MQELLAQTAKEKQKMEKEAEKVAQRVEGSISNEKLKASVVKQSFCVRSEWYKGISSN